MLLGLWAAEVRPVLEAIGSRGVCISTAVETPEEADALVREVGGLQSVRGARRQG